MHVTVYTKPHCVQCAATERKLNQLGITYEAVDVTTDEEAYNLIVSKGFQQAPVVNADGDWWSGYRPDLIAGLA